MAYRPTANDELFLQAWLTRKLRKNKSTGQWGHEKFRTTCRRAGLAPDWFIKKRARSPDFMTWLLEQNIQRETITYLDVYDICVNALRDQANSAKGPNERLARLVMEAIRPPLQRHLVQAELSRETKTPATIHLEVAEYLNDEASGEICENCGAPKIDWASLQAGGESIRLIPRLVEKEDTDALGRQGQETLQEDAGGQPEAGCDLSGRPNGEDDDGDFEPQA